MAPSSTVGIGGNSSESVPFILASKRWQVRPTISGSVSVFMSIRSSGREFTKSVSSRAGIVTSPSSSTWAPIRVVIAISRFVADKTSILSSVEIFTFCSTGKLLREATALPTIERPRLRFC